MARRFSCRITRRYAADGLHRHRIGAYARDDGAQAPFGSRREGGELCCSSAPARRTSCYFGPLLKLPKEFIDINFAFSRVAASEQYVQDRIRTRSADVARMVADANCTSTFAA